MPALEAILLSLAASAIWEAFKLGINALGKKTELKKLHAIINTSVKELAKGDKQLKKTLHAMFSDPSISYEMQRYLSASQVNINTLLDTFKKTNYYKQDPIPEDKLKQIFTHLQEKIKEGIERDTELRDKLAFVYIKEILGKVENLKDYMEQTFGKIDEIQGYLLPKIEQRQWFYVEYFNSIAGIREREFERMGLYTEPYILETALDSMTGESQGALKAIKDHIEKGPQIVFVLGESGSGKTFTFLKLFEELRDEFLNGSEKIPLFVELYRLKSRPLKQLILEDIEEACFKQDKDNYVMFMDGINEAGSITGCLDEVGRFAKSHRNTQIFASAQRKEEELDERQYKLYNIQPFNPEQVKLYLSKLEGKFQSKKDVEAFYDELDSVLKEEVTRPMFLYMLGASYDGQSRPNNLGQLFQGFEEFICGRREKRSPHTRPALRPLYRNDALPFVAFNMCKKGDSPTTLNDMKDFLKEFKEEESSQFDIHNFIEKITQEYWLATLRDDTCRFTHDLLRDYFAAKHIKDKKLEIAEVVDLTFPASGKGKVNTTFASVAQLLCGIESEGRTKELISSILSKTSRVGTYLATSCFALSTLNDLDLFKEIDASVDMNDPQHTYLERLPLFYQRGLKLLEGKVGQPDYVDCQGNLATAYLKLSEIRNKEVNLKRAIKGFKEMFKVYTVDAFPEKYATTQNNLGNAYGGLAEVRDKENNLDEAIKAYEEALKVRTFEALPVDYAQTQNNLGIAHRNLAGVRSREKNLGDAIKSYKEALKVLTYDALPVQYATTQNNLGVAYRNLANVRDRENNLGEARKAYEEALKVRTFEAFPVDYATTKLNIGLLYFDTSRLHAEKGDAKRAIDSLKESEAAFTDGLEVFKKEKLNVLVESAEKLLAQVRQILDKMKDLGHND